MGMKRCVAGSIPEQSFKVMSFVCHEWRRQVSKGIIQELGEWFGREVCVKEGGKER